MMTMNAIQESVEALLERKAEEMGGVLTSREEEYVRLQVERNELVLQFPHRESRGEEVLKRLQKTKNRLKKLAKGRPVDDVLKLPLKSEDPKTAAERTRSKRRNMSKEARDKEREDDRRRKASPEELERARKRMKAPEQVQKTKERMRTPEQMEKTKERMRNPEQMEKTKERMKDPEQVLKAKERMRDPEQVEKAKERMKAPEQLEKAKERMCLPVNREKDAARKREKRRLARVEKEKSDECPRAPHLKGTLQVMLPTDDLRDALDTNWKRKDLSRQPIVEGPTYSLDQPLRLRAMFTCYPPPTIVWLKNGKVLARDTIKYFVKEGVNEISDCKKERVAPKSKLRFCVESYYRFKFPVSRKWDLNSSNFDLPRFVNERVFPAELMQEGWSDFIIPEPQPTDEGVYSVRIFNNFGVVEDFIEVRTQIDNTGTNSANLSHTWQMQCNLYFNFPRLPSSQ